jgi:hypothetical protein
VTFTETLPFSNDGHLLFDDGEAIWQPIVDRFLKDNKLALRDQPISIPEIAAPSSLQKAGQDEFAKYLEDTPNKAFAISGSRFGWAARRRTEEEAKRDALNFCASTTSVHCDLINVNNVPNH